MGQNYGSRGQIVRWSGYVPTKIPPSDCHSLPRFEDSFRSETCQATSSNARWGFEASVGFLHGFVFFASRRWPIGTRWRGQFHLVLNSPFRRPKFWDPTNQFVGVNDSKWLKQKSIKKWPVAIDCLWLLWISYLYLSNNPLSISSIIIYYLTSIPINIYKLSRLPPMLPSICRVVARRRESEHLYHAASLRWGRLMRHSWNLVWLQVRMWGKICGSILDHT